MATVLADLLKSSKETLGSNTGVLKLGFSSLLVIALEAILSSTGDFFKCPKEGHFTYGLVFLFVPAVVAFIITFYLSSFNKETQGCCYKRVRKPKHCQCTCHDKESKKCPCNITEILQALVSSLEAGFLVIFWTFLQKKYYTCAVFGSADQLTNATGITKTTLETRYLKAQTDSETIAFAMLPFILGIPVLLLSVKRCNEKPKKEESTAKPDIEMTPTTISSTNPS